MNIKSILIKDNFFDDPDYYRNIALDNKDNFQTPLFSNQGWKGYRYHYYEKNFSKILKFFKHYYSFKEDFSLTTCFHLSLEKTKNSCFPSFEKYKFHKDSSFYAGVIYLTPNPPNKCGTTLIDPDTNDNIEVENFYNRLICYPSCIEHAPTDLFGNTIYDGRLTLTFFINKIC